VESSSVLATVLQLLFHLSAAKACYTNELAGSVLQCKRQFARNGQISEFQIFAPPMLPGADAPLPATTGNSVLTERNIVQKSVQAVSH